MYHKEHHWHIRNLLPKAPRLVSDRAGTRTWVLNAKPLRSFPVLSPEMLSELAPQGLGWPHKAAWKVHPLSDAARARDGWLLEKARRQVERGPSIISEVAGAAATSS